MLKVPVVILLLAAQLAASGLRPVRFSTDHLGDFLAEGDRIAEALAAQQSDPAPTGFRINVIKSTPQNNLRKGRATKAVVEVRDRNNKPVAGALVLFAMPRSGPGGAFTGGGQTLSVTTNSAGQAVANYTPNQLAGMFNVEVSAQVNGATVATSSIPQANIAATAAAAGGLSGGAIGAIVGVAAAAAVGIGVGLAGGNNNSPAPTPAPVIPTPPSVRIGPGGAAVIGPR
jgi:hypothetical protein